MAKLPRGHPLRDNCKLAILLGEGDLTKAGCPSGRRSEFRVLGIVD